MITQVEINRFRSIDHMVLDLKKTTVLCGPNNSGKTTIITAIGWCITGTAANYDQLGVGEKDSISLLPINAQDGDVVSVTITMDNGNTYSRELKVEIEEGKIQAPASVLKSNGKKISSLTKWQAELYEDLNFKPAFPVLGKNEPLVYINPVYALLQLHPTKELRPMLVQLGCSIPNEAIYKLGFEDLRETIEVQNKGDFVSARSDINKALKDAESNRDYYKKRLKELKDYPDTFDGELLKELKIQAESIRQKKSNAIHSTTEGKVSHCEVQLEALEFELKKELDGHQLKYKYKIQDLESRLGMERAAMISNRDQRIKPYETAVKATALKVEVAERSMKVYERVLNNLREQSTDITKLLKKAIENESEAFIKREAIKNEKYEGEVECPNCKQLFYPDQEAFKRWNARHREDMEKYNQVLAESPSLKKELKAKKDEITAKGKQALAEYNQSVKEYEDMRSKFEEVSNEYKKQIEAHEDSSKLEDTKRSLEIAKIEAEKRPKAAIILDEKIKAKKAEIEALKKGAVVDNGAVLDELNIELANVNAKIEEQLAIYKYCMDKKDADRDYNAAKTAANRYENLLYKVDGFVKAMIEAISTKAYEMTGIRFVMLEPNLTNDDVQEVCYAVDENGVPFKNINSSRKVEIGCKFIEKIKSILEKQGITRNTFPIITDGLEKVDHIEKLNSFTNEQLIVTRVTTDESISVK